MGGGGEGQSVVKAEQARIRCMKAYNVYIFFQICTSLIISLLHYIYSRSHYVLHMKTQLNRPNLGEYSSFGSSVDPSAANNACYFVRHIIMDIC